MLGECTRITTRCRSRHADMLGMQKRAARDARDCQLARACTDPGCASTGTPRSAAWAVLRCCSRHRAAAHAAVIGAVICCFRAAIVETATRSARCVEMRLGQKFATRLSRILPRSKSRDASIFPAPAQGSPRRVRFPAGAAQFPCSETRREYVRITKCYQLVMDSGNRCKFPARSKIPFFPADIPATRQRSRILQP